MNQREMSNLRTSPDFCCCWWHTKSTNQSFAQW